MKGEVLGNGGGYKFHQAREPNARPQTTQGARDNEGWKKKG